MANTTTQKYIHAEKLLGAAFTATNPQENQALWNALEAIRVLLFELRANTDQIEQRLARLEGAAPPTAP